MRAAATLYPSVIRPGVESDGRLSYRLGSLAAANGIVVGKVHDAAADVDAMLALCRIARAGAPDLWSAFLRFSSKAAVVDLVRDEEAFAYFDFFGSPRVMHFLTRVGVSPNDPNAHYCLDLTCDIDALRKLDAAALSERVKQEPRPIRRLKVNGSPLLYPLWDIDPERFGETSEDELTRTASSVRADQEFMSALTRAAALRVIRAVNAGSSWGRWARPGSKMGIGFAYGGRVGVPLDSPGYLSPSIEAIAEAE
jgi:exodeoxyribonuclease-1